MVYNFGGVCDSGILFSRNQFLNKSVSHLEKEYEGKQKYSPDNTSLAQHRTGPQEIENTMMALNPPAERLLSWKPP